MVKNVLSPGRLPRARARAPTRVLCLAAALGCASVALASVSFSANAEPATTPVAGHWRTGLALHGFDPVAYFAERRAVPGLAEFERETGGATWRFRNEGNMAAFAADPGAYAPRFAGYDPLALGRGVVTAGNPLVWLIHDGRLFLFFDDGARAAFAADPHGSIAAAERSWSLLRANLLP